MLRGGGRQRVDGLILPLAARYHSRISRKKWTYARVIRRLRSRRTIFQALSVSDAGKWGHAVETLGADIRHRSILHRHPGFDRHGRPRRWLRTLLLLPHCPLTMSQYTLAPVRRENIYPVLHSAQGYLISNTVKKGDIYRVINGYDDCANVCGRVTPKETNPEFRCKGADMTENR